jgi:hypothetical protein
MGYWIVDRLKEIGEAVHKIPGGAVVPGTLWRVFGEMTMVAPCVCAGGHLTKWKSKTGVDAFKQQWICTKCGRQQFFAIVTFEKEL